MVFTSWLTAEADGDTDVFLYTPQTGDDWPPLGQAELFRRSIDASAPAASVPGVGGGELFGPSASMTPPSPPPLTPGPATRSRATDCGARCPRAG